MEPIKPEEKMQEKTGWQSFWELVRFAFIALVIVIPIRIFIAEPFIVSGSSMVPTFENGDYLIIDKISYELGNLKRDDVVFFDIRATRQNSLSKELLVFQMKQWI